MAIIRGPKNTIEAIQMNIQWTRKTVRIIRSVLTDNSLSGLQKVGVLIKKWAKWWFGPRLHFARRHPYFPLWFSLVTLLLVGLRQAI